MAAITAMLAVLGVTTIGMVYRHFSRKGLPETQCILLPSFSCRDGEQVTRTRAGILQLLVFWRCLEINN